MHSRLYTKDEILALKKIREMVGPITYQNPPAPQFEELFLKLTGIHRSSGPLYMAYWRLEKGKYDHLLN